ncbi:hypothetical protein [Myroides odoratimimus]|uniref:hypothetical protein n=1 Tax=Myroides odoratimimus TaxID=76832 RepID=UPI003F427CD4
MKQHQVLDNVIKTLSKLRTNEISNYSSKFLTFRLNEIDNTFKKEFGNIEKQQILSAVSQLDKDGLISIIKENANIVSMEFNSDFFKALDIENGWYNFKHFKEQIDLELLAANLELLTLNLEKLKNNNSFSNETLTNIASVATISSTVLELISNQ